MQAERAISELLPGFRAASVTPQVTTLPPTNTEIELCLLVSGQVTYFLAGQFHLLRAGRLSVFWAGLPHRRTQVAPGTRALILSLPLAWFLDWRLDPRFTTRLISGDLVQETDPKRHLIDNSLFRGWTEDLQNGSPEVRHAARLEVEARLRRFARTAVLAPPPEAEDHPAPQVERIARYIGDSFHEPITITTIADAVRLNPNYTMTLFRQGCGMSLWEYVLRVRLSHSQRLLLTTERSIERIALECGFGSSSRFFASFKKQHGCTPRQYRHLFPTS